MLHPTQQSEDSMDIWHPPSVKESLKLSLVIENFSLEHMGCMQHSLETVKKNSSTLQVQ
jgi:hypothetical protein